MIAGRRQTVSKRLPDMISSGKSRLFPVLAAAIFLICTSSNLQSDTLELKLELKQELVFPRVYNHLGLSGCTSTKDGYVLRSRYRLYFFSHDMTLTHITELDDTTNAGSQYLSVVEDTLIYVLGSDGCVSLYNLKGEQLQRWRYSRGIKGKNIAVLGGTIAISGERYEAGNPRPAFILYDTTRSMVASEDLYLDSLIDYLNIEKKADMYISAQVAAFKAGFAVTTSIGPEVFIFSQSGHEAGIIRDMPPGYKALSQAPPFDIEKAHNDTSYSKDWDSSWDFVVGYNGIRVLDDSFLVVPRREKGNPYYIDIYNLNQRRFVERLESNKPLVGASSSLLFFSDTLTPAFAKFSAYRIVHATADENATDSFLVARKGCGGCDRPLTRYEFVESPEGINAVDSISAGNGRVACVFSMHAFEPDSLKRFCNPAKKNMFIFYCPTHFAGELLTDTLYACLKDKEDWALTIVLCYSEPLELSLYSLDLPGDQILVNRNVAIPDATLELSDVGLPPIAVALSEGGEQVIAGYSLGPRYDGQKKQMNAGITFDEFLDKCGILP